MRDTDTSFEGAETDKVSIYQFPRKPSKAERRAVRRQEKARAATVMFEEKPLLPKNATQQEMLDALSEKEQVFAIGPAGTGKTYLAARWGMNALIKGEFSGLTISRPTVTKPKHRQGFLPGTDKEKIEPWLIPIISAFKDGVAPSMVDKMTRDGRIEYLSFETMRGRSIKDRVIILDEAQNCDYLDLKMFLTRVGENSKLIVCGDPEQVDINDSGLEAVLDMIEDFDLTAEIIEFDDADVVRSGIAAEWVRAFRKADK